MKFFLIPGGLVTGGSAGIALTVSHLTGLSVSAFMLIFNIAMLALGFLVLGGRFALTTVVSTFAYPLDKGGGSDRELPSVERIVHDIDPECFMTVSKISEIKGRGFSLNKKYQ